ncbi:hypothetical protein V8D89_002533 [Ganoderma adspersum]
MIQRIWSLRVCFAFLALYNCHDCTSQPTQQPWRSYQGGRRERDLRSSTRCIRRLVTFFSNHEIPRVTGDVGVYWDVARRDRLSTGVQTEASGVLIVDWKCVFPWFALPPSR